MDRLPDLALLEVFSFINVEERFKTLRMICKRWKQVVEFQTQNDLVVYGREYPLKHRWPSDNRRVDIQSVIRKSLFDLYLTNGYYKAIKRLFLYRIDYSGLERVGLMTKLVDCICQLEELSIDQTPYLLSPFNNQIGYENINLDGLTFPNLRVLSVKQMFRAKASITAPKLEIFVIWNGSFQGYKEPLKITLSHPERLRCLQCPLIGQEINVFSNLEHLSAQHAKLDFDLSNHQKLKQLDLCVCIVFERAEFSIHETIEVLMKQKEQLKLDHLKITQFGTENPIIDHRLFRTSFGSGEFCPYNSVRSFTKNLTIDYLPWSICLQWWDFLPTTEGFSELCRTRLNVERVNLFECDQSNLVIKFLVEIGGVKSLRMQNCSFDQQFFDQLTTVPYIAVLQIIRFFNVTDFEFISGIKFLGGLSLYVDPDFPLDSFFGVLKKCKIRRLKLQIVAANKKAYSGRGPRLEMENNKILLRIGRPKRDLECDTPDGLSDVFKDEIQKFSRNHLFYA